MIYFVPFSLRSIGSVCMDDSQCRSVAQSGSAFASGAKGRGFKSLRSDHFPIAFKLSIFFFHLIALASPHCFPFPIPSGNTLSLKAPPQSVPYGNSTSTVKNRNAELPPSRTSHHPSDEGRVALVQKPSTLSYFANSHGTHPLFLHRCSAETPCLRFCSQHGRRLRLPH